MRLVIQRVKRAEVKIVKLNKVVGKIGSGFLILVGVGEGDTKNEAKKLAEKTVKLRIMGDSDGKMNLSIKDVINSGILVVSQFTLYADTSGGNRPSFVAAAKPGLANEIYLAFVNYLKEVSIKVETGEFGEHMEISALLDGPVTILE